jgi:UDP-N-acetylmuramoyl-tripeptide--D-alanyl-D-alanine ligase
MLELGDATDEGHHEVGEAAGRTLDWLMVVGAGAGATGIADGAEAAGLDRSVIHRVRDADAALAALPPRLRDGDVVLVKASRGIGLDAVVDGLRRELGAGRSR